MTAEVAPFFDDVADGPVGGSARWLTTADGIRVRAGHWPAAPGAAAKGTILLFPGRTEYIEKYGRAARTLTDAGYAVASIDWRGQGISARLMENRSVGHVGAFSDYQHDVAALRSHVREVGLPEPCHLLAHSMGGSIGLRALVEGLPVNSAAFTGPMWGIQMTGLLRPVAWTLSSLSRPLRLSGRMAPGQEATTYVARAPFEGNTLTTDEGMWNYMRAQAEAHPDLTLGGPSLNWLYEALTEIRRLNLRPAPATPTLTFLGTEEAINDPAAIRRRMADWTNGELVEVPGAQHEILMERPDLREPVFRRIIGHFDAHG